MRLEDVGVISVQKMHFPGDVQVLMLRGSNVKYGISEKKSRMSFTVSLILIFLFQTDVTLTDVTDSIWKR